MWLFGLLLLDPHPSTGIGTDSVSIPGHEVMMHNFTFFVFAHE
jgi:hypothetical protein